MIADMAINGLQRQAFIGQQLNNAKANGKSGDSTAIRRTRRQFRQASALYKNSSPSRINTRAIHFIQRANTEHAHAATDFL
jgi:hypothetical protein